MIHTLENRTPLLKGDTFVAPNATLIGRVTLEAQASVWFNCVLRGDCDEIIVGEGSNIQDGSVLHTDVGFQLRVGANCTIGHMVMLHGCEIGEGSLIGIKAVILNGSKIGKNSLVLNRKAGSWFFLGELFVDIALPVDEPTARDHCGSCHACLDVCPTEAFVGERVLDARRCISYLTIELKGPIPMELRSKIGNRVFGCDDCQIVCPWNRFARPTGQNDFQPRHSLDNAELAMLFRWTEDEFLSRTEGSPLRRTGYQNWLRNLAVGLGNAPPSIPVLEALQSRRDDPSELVREHVEWALAQHAGREPS